MNIGDVTCLLNHPLAQLELAFLGKEWLVKTNSASSTPYLFKFTSSTIDLTCCALFTDTKSVWTEELTSQQLARRWRQCNPRAPQSFSNMEDEDEWRFSVLELLAKAHTLGGVNGLSFEVTDTNYSDIAFALECDSFKWRWETCFIGHEFSADVISKQLVFPLISTNQLLFSSTEPIQDMTDIAVENAVDKIGRTARRAIDTHIKNALAKPRISTILRRMTAMFGSLHDLPSIISTAEEPSLQVPSTPKASPDLPPKKATDDFQFSRDIVSLKFVNTAGHISPIHSGYQDLVEAPRARSPMQISPPRQQASELPPTKADSATESSTDEGEQLSLAGARSRSGMSPVRKLTPRRSASPGVSHPPAARPSASPIPRPSASRTKTLEVRPDADKTSDDDSSPQKPPPKRIKPAQMSSSESDSESERRARVAQLKAGPSGSGSGMGGGPAKRNVRQPIKRGGKRF
ncbi:hypothetical protein P691DRAFT_798218 [Macrolepiota fuliginosa MF-IS2]|uniref:XLF-like N-terminal domain-containing protein n=1 Tax=Macrolepiota fuliginosa MF-IS2 TaxID=1400762 RepID=A0A9P5XG28_9AGAR|nr:hypothetical protein P691DRAFT_798218 [Macrolepiota fuliginosa MF-IS2]